ncbi:MAG: alanine--tRNA ligase [Candidatus Aenigmarchaeota archaeon]|nr:alanine--tRNA ligase [Candidatus Aenigmarchaeota archaeon]
MFTKEILKKQFAKEWKKHYQLEIFREKGFIRKTCPKCGKNFWTLDSERILCGDPPCENYGFIGKPITKNKWDYVQTWKEFESFFRKNGHSSIPRYPVIDRWRPDLFFTIASIQDFQRIDQGNIVFEYPADPLVVPQVCLRFPDIPNIGVTGRHHSSFIMSGQHSFGSYWKDRCIELNFRFLTKTMGIPEKELVYTEDVWAMPDFSAFGPCMETFSKGLELVNSVFMQFTKKGQSYVELPEKVIDVGWGHERLVWFSNGTHTGYDAVFEPVIKWMKAKSGLKETELFDRYSVMAGSLNFDEIKDARKIREDIAKKLGVSVKQLNDIIEPMQALYAIADHVKTLLFAISDGGIPSNVGGGYNLRVLLRRALSFIKEFGFQFTLDEIAEFHSKHLKPIFPELREGLPSLSKILEIEKVRYEKTLEKAAQLIQKEAKRGRIDDETMIRLYTSNGITPELIEKVAKSENLEIQIPEDFYSILTSQHMTGKKEEEEEMKMDVSGIKKTEAIFYEKPYQVDFRAKVLKASRTNKGMWLVLDKTCFYPEGGGQPGDRGFLKSNGKRIEVSDTQKIGEVIMHKVSSPIKPGTFVEGAIDWDRRYQLMKMHTATHILGGAARNVLGKHIWQAGAKKGLESSRIDFTHYQPFTQEETERIEKKANEIVKRNLKVNMQFMPRSEAESKYGFVLYQGGASPGKMVRVVNVSEGFDAEACAGTHVQNAGEIEIIKIIRADRIQDGINRIEFTCSKKASVFEKGQESLFKEAVEKIKAIDVLKDSASDLSAENVQREIQSAAEIFSVDSNMLPKTIERFSREIRENQEEINKLRERLGTRKIYLWQEEGIKIILSKPGKTLPALCQTIFSIWKEQSKITERLRADLAKAEGKKLIGKAKENQIFEIIPAERKMLIEIANEIISLKPSLTVILANQAGEIVCMSKSKNSGQLVKEICQKAGGSGGGSPQLGQGKLELSKLLKIMDKEQ